MGMREARVGPQAKSYSKLIHIQPSSLRSTRPLAVSGWPSVNILSG